MNATYTIDHLQAITHVTSLLSSNSALGDTAAVSKPKTAATTHYDPAGKEVATVSNTSYEGVTFAADGTISGGSLSHDSLHPNGTKLSTTSVSFRSDGKPASAEINVNNISGDGNFKKVQMDMSGVKWNNSFVISSGQVKMTTIDALTQQKIHDGLLQFDKETIISGSITHYDPTQNGAVTGYSEIDYSGAIFLGNNITGGRYAVKFQTPGKILQSSSQITLSGSGRLQAIETTNMDAKSAAVTSRVTVDFSKVLFNARNEFASGDMGYTVNDEKGTLLSKTTVNYNNTFPALSTTLVYDNKQVQSKIVVDYSGARFNNNRQVINSTKKVEIFSGIGKLLSSTIVGYDKYGKKNQKWQPEKAIEATAQPSNTNAIQSQPSFKDLLPNPKDPGISTKTDETRRADGTLEQLRVTFLQNNVPVAASIQLFATDGKTVIKTFEMGLKGLAYDAGSKVVAGTLNLQGFSGTQTLTSQSAVQY